MVYLVVPAFLSVLFPDLTKKFLRGIAPGLGLDKHFETLYNRFFETVPKTYLVSDSTVRKGECVVEYYEESNAVVFRARRFKRDFVEYLTRKGHAVQSDAPVVVGKPKRLFKTPLYLVEDTDEMYVGTKWGVEQVLHINYRTATAFSLFLVGCKFKEPAKQALFVAVERKYGKPAANGLRFVMADA
jgi:hypothetical protein